MAIIKAKSNVKEKLKEQQRKELFVSEEAQNRLAEILADAPTVEKFAGTEWEMRPLRNGTQYLIINEVCKINKAENASYGDILKGMLTQIPSTVKVLTLALLNDKNLIYQNGDPNAGFSKVFKKTYDTIMWEAENIDLAHIMLDCLEMIDVSFFTDALDMLRIFRASVTEKKRTRIKIPGQR